MAIPSNIQTFLSTEKYGEVRICLTVSAYNRHGILHKKGQHHGTVAQPSIDCRSKRWGIKLALDTCTRLRSPSGQLPSCSVSIPLNASGLLIRNGRRHGPYDEWEVLIPLNISGLLIPSIPSGHTYSYCTSSFNPCELPPAKPVASERHFASIRSQNSPAAVLPSSPPCREFPAR